MLLWVQSRMWEAEAGVRDAVINAMDIARRSETSTRRKGTSRSGARNGDIREEVKIKTLYMKGQLAEMASRVLVGGNWTSWHSPNFTMSLPLVFAKRYDPFLRNILFPRFVERMIAPLFHARRQDGEPTLCQQSVDVFQEYLIEAQNINVKGKETLFRDADTFARPFQVEAEELLKEMNEPGFAFLLWEMQQVVGSLHSFRLLFESREVPGDKRTLQTTFIHPILPVLKI
eukprot:GHVN01002132.1.p1 GENE.GHVN01002132.1~~GHVN01002132.1.p1  ORF type:complete len:230 (+),score=27.88 GHVN01002132.1:213-902(+)